ncbi:hypothetical protein CHBNIII7_02260 [Haemophilus influenzae]|nr:hypothetical protein CHBNIII7_02260 [Haemophilus influenzae]
MIAQASTLVLKIYICEIKKAQAKDACASRGELQACVGRRVLSDALSDLVFFN